MRLSRTETHRHNESLKGTSGWDEGRDDTLPSKEHWTCNWQQVGSSTGRKNTRDGIEAPEEGVEGGKEWEKSS